MSIRLLKIVLVTLIGLQALLYVAANIANWDSGIGAVGYVLGMSGNEVYGNNIFPPITNPALITIAYLLILTGEAVVGVLSLKGAWDLWRCRKASADIFNEAKKYAILGIGMTLVVWFGGFIVIGGALFQMWQSQVGAGSFNDAFVYVVTGGLVLLFLTRPEQKLVNGLEVTRAR